VYLPPTVPSAPRGAIPTAPAHARRAAGQRCRARTARGPAQLERRRLGERQGQRETDANAARIGARANERLVQMMDSEHCHAERGCFKRVWACRTLPWRGGPVHGRQQDALRVLAGRRTALPTCRQREEEPQAQDQTTAAGDGLGYPRAVRRRTRRRLLGGRALGQ
jgi:hypothetical protein